MADGHIHLVPRMQLVIVLTLLAWPGSAMFWSVPPLRAYDFFNQTLGSAWRAVSKGVVDLFSNTACNSNDIASKIASRNLSLKRVASQPKLLQQRASELVARASCEAMNLKSWHHRTRMLHESWQYSQKRNVSPIRTKYSMVQPNRIRTEFRQAPN